MSYSEECIGERNVQRWEPNSANIGVRCSGMSRIIWRPGDIKLFNRELMYEIAADFNDIDGYLTELAGTVNLLDTADVSTVGKFQMTDETDDNSALR